MTFEIHSDITNRSMTVLSQMARREKARPQCLCPHPRGVRGEAEGTDRGDEGRDCGSAAADGGGGASTAGTGERQEESEEV